LVSKDTTDSTVLAPFAVDRSPLNTSLHSQGVRPSSGPASRGRKHFCHGPSHGSFPQHRGTLARASVDSGRALQPRDEVVPIAAAPYHVIEVPDVRSNDIDVSEQSGPRGPSVSSSCDQVHGSLCRRRWWSAKLGVVPAGLGWVLAEPDLEAIFSQVVSYACLHLFRRAVPTSKIAMPFQKRHAPRQVRRVLSSYVELVVDSWSPQISDESSYHLRTPSDAVTFKLCSLRTGASKSIAHVYLPFESWRCSPSVVARLLACVTISPTSRRRRAASNTAPPLIV